jgi:hypothetical protein
LAADSAVSRVGVPNALTVNDDDYFLDTSAHIERHGGERAVRDHIRGLLAAGQHATSTHVLREWKHIIHGSAVAILNACEGASNVGDVRARLRNGFGRQPAHHWLALDMICGEPTGVHEIELRAERFLRSTADVLFELDVADVRNASNCMLARERVGRDVRTGEWKIRTKCSRTECDCDQIAFTDANAAQIDDAIAALAASGVSGHRKMARIAKDAMARPDKTYRKSKNCWGGSGLGGDISIALECGLDEVLLTTDRSFDAICPAIGRAHHRVDGTRAP